MSQPYDEFSDANDAWVADPDRVREDFFLTARRNVPRLVHPSPLPEYLILAALGGVCGVLVYFALRLLLT